MGVVVSNEFNGWLGSIWCLVLVISAGCDSNAECDRPVLTRDTVDGVREVYVEYLPDIKWVPGGGDIPVPVEDAISASLVAFVSDDGGQLYIQPKELSLVKHFCGEEFWLYLVEYPLPGAGGVGESVFYAVTMDGRVVSERVSSR